jgi:hypothetical protein
MICSFILDLVVLMDAREMEGTVRRGMRKSILAQHPANAHCLSPPKLSSKNRN